MSNPVILAFDPNGCLPSADCLRRNGTSLDCHGQISSFDKACRGLPADNLVAVAIHCNDQQLMAVASRVKGRCVGTPLHAIVAPGANIDELEALEIGVDNLLIGEPVADQLAQLTTPVGHEVERRQPVARPVLDGHFYMKIGEDELASVVQFIGNSGKAGEIEVQFHADGLVGRLFVGENQILHAECGGKSGAEALAAMLLGGTGEAHFFAGRSTRQRSLAQRTDQALLAASVSADESRSRPTMA